MSAKYTAPAAPVESKVKAATSAAVLIGLGVAILNQAVGNSQLMGSLPPWVQALIAVVVPPLVTFYSGWKAQHTPRPDTGVLTPEE